jgi:hypothetical protein
VPVDFRFPSNISGKSREALLPLSEECLRTTVTEGGVSHAPLDSCPTLELCDRHEECRQVLVLGTAVDLNMKFRVIFGSMSIASRYCQGRRGPTIVHSFADRGAN